MIISKAGENDIILMPDYYVTSVTVALKVVDELLEGVYLCDGGGYFYAAHHA